MYLVVFVVPWINSSIFLLNAPPQLWSEASRWNTSNVPLTTPVLMFPNQEHLGNSAAALALCSLYQQHNSRLIYLRSTSQSPLHTTRPLYDDGIYELLWRPSRPQAVCTGRHSDAAATAADDREEGGVLAEEDRHRAEGCAGERSHEQGWCVISSYKTL